jgi:hypothetical protein
MVKPRAKFAFGNIEVVLGLQSHPELGRISKETGEPQGSIRSDSALAKHNFVDATRVHADANRNMVLANIIGLMNSSNNTSPG